METSTVLITGSRKGIGRFLAEHFLEKNFQVIGVSRTDSDLKSNRYEHHCLDICDEKGVLELFQNVRKRWGHLDCLINNAGIASFNHSFMTPVQTVRSILETNVIGTFLFCREAAKLMMKKKSGRIINFSSVAVPLQIDGEAAYAASKAAVVTLTEVLAREFAPFGITVNAVGPTPVDTDLMRSVPKEKIDKLISRQAVPRLGQMRDIANVVDFYVRPESDFVTGQTIYLGGVN